MNLMTRRDAMRASSFALTAPAMGTVLGRGPFAQIAADATPKSTAPILLNPDLCNFIMDDIARTMGDMATNKTTHEDLLSNARSITMLANHLRYFEVDRLSRQIVDSIDLSNVDLSESPGIGVYYKHLLRYNPSANINELKQRVRFPPDILMAAKQRVMENGVTWHLDIASDLLRFKATTLPFAKSAQVAPINAGKSHAKILPLIFRSTNSSHLFHESGSLSSILASCKNWVQEQACDLLGNDDLNYSFQAALVLAINSFGLTGACASLIGGAAFATLASDGVDIGSAFFVSAACEMIGTITDQDIVQFGVGVAVNHVVSNWITNNCD